MNSKERLVAAWRGQPHDHVPLTTWCFGVSPPANLRWERDGNQVAHWYSKRMEHIHTLPQPWTLQDDLRRVLAWQALGVDDVLDVSVPWSMDPEVTYVDRSHVRDGDTVLERRYQTPSGPLLHRVRQTGEDPGVGWVIQPDHVPLFEDYNIPRAVKHVVAEPHDVALIGHLYRGPDASAQGWFEARMAQVAAFSSEHGVPVQAWSAFGMDGVVWMSGVEGAVMLAMDAPDVFRRLVEIVAEADYARTALALATPGVDMVVERGWYSSTDFWSPRLFDEYVYPHVSELASLAHRHGKLLAYTMTTGVELLGPRLADAGVDVLYFVDPLQDKLSLQSARQLLGDRMTLVGGVNTLSLSAEAGDDLRAKVGRAMDILGPTGRFVLHPVDAIFPDTPWIGIERLIECWRACR